MDPPGDDPLAYKDAIFLVAAQVHRRARDAGRARRPPRAVPEPRAERARRRHGRSTSTRSSTSTSPTSSIARRAARRRSSSRSAPGSCSSSRRRSASRRSASARTTSSSARSRAGRPTRRSRSSATTTPTRLSIVSFVVRHDGRYLHHNFVVALLNDLFGIQSRGGCSCAGPYGHRLLGHRHRDLARVRARDRARLRGHQARLGPGQLQLLHQRGGVRVPPRRGRPRRDATAGGSCPTTASSPRPACGATAAGRPEPPASLRDVRYDDGRMA